MTEFINLVSNKFPISSDLGNVVGFNGWSLDFTANNFKETFPDFETDLM